jgi:LPS sulfotransferase NodH
MTASIAIHTAYAICAVQRSGSFLLCEALKNTGLAGMPEEYFLCHDGENWEDGWWARQHGVTSRSAFLELVLAKGTTGNGVFGTKLMWNYFPQVISHFQEMPAYQGLGATEILPKLLPNLHYIWIVRRDKVKQAVSWSIAAQTDIYAAWQAAGKSPPEPVFDFEQIDLLHNLVLVGEAGWQAFFEKSGVVSLQVVYEELVEAYEVTALRILDYLGVAYPPDLLFGERKMKKQATELNERWAEKYREMKQ